MPNRECNLECVKGRDEEDEVVEFVGPVKIILVDQPKRTYRSKVCNAAFIVLAQMCMATTCLLVIFYSLSFKQKSFMKALHIFLCTLGMNLLLPTGVLTMNSLNGAAAPMTLPDRRFEHGIVQVFGLLIAIGGSVVSYFAGYSTFYTSHSLLGIVANLLGVLNILVGMIVCICCKLTSKDKFRKSKHGCICIHKTLGILTITISSVCLISGLLEDSFNEWLPLPEIMYCLCIFCIFYTCVVICIPLRSTNGH